MTTQEQRAEYEERLRAGFKYLNIFMVGMWRLGLGNILNAWPAVVGRILVIVHTGRKSGNEYLTPVNYTVIDNDIYVLAAFGERSHWYQNMLSKPQIEVWLSDGWWEAVAEDASDAHGYVGILRQVLIDSGFAAPLFEGIRPRQMSEAELQELWNTFDYRLLRISLTGPRTGPGGPGEYAWVWPITTMMLAWRLLTRPRKKRK